MPNLISQAEFKIHTFPSCTPKNKNEVDKLQGVYIFYSRIAFIDMYNIYINSNENRRHRQSLQPQQSTDRRAFTTQERCHARLTATVMRTA